MQALWIALALALAADETAAQIYPAKPVKLVVPAPAGGGPTDVPARLAADGLSALVGQRFVVENKPGAGGLIGAEFVARAEPDGYTLLFANTSVVAVIPALQPKIAYDPAAFVPIGFVSNSPQLLIASLNFPAKSVRELVDYAKAHPGKVNFASGGMGTLPHLTYELFRLEAGFDAIHVPYAGGAPATSALIAGQADVLFDLVRTRVKSGEVRALAITGETRDPELPDVPTIAEAGYPAVTSTSITGGLSHFVVDEPLDRAILEALRKKDHAFLAALEPRTLKAGSSEIRNWIVVAAAAAQLDLSWVSYTPAYRTPALTGTGLCFARWS